ncbi:pre-mRNA-splicing factor SLU7 isoform X2 [Ziziphus jujuba]|uniref:Pre-mRNA-splicing factor SLU7 isoform X2 n=1 Tax=Ziziphus jujuba TaxID=326968 RepID=A0ABM3ZU63_ZIZJJ|nr:pre-mRNA-splicing factor SLU7 isoform X2 [Ziziphus jujuba]
MVKMIILLSPISVFLTLASKYQRNWKPYPNDVESSSNNIDAMIYRASKYRKHACGNCGAMMHGSNSSTKRYLKGGPKSTNEPLGDNSTSETVTQKQNNPGIL